jgi:hypothetical protein
VTTPAKGAFSKFYTPAPPPSDPTISPALRAYIVQELRKIAAVTRELSDRITALGG